jgi:hypothetical protein
MPKHPQNHQQPQDSADQLQDRIQRDQETRSRQALSNQGSQDRKPDRSSIDHARSRDRAKQPT